MNDKDVLEELETVTFIFENEEMKNAFVGWFVDGGGEQWMWFAPGLEHTLVKHDQLKDDVLAIVSE